VRYFPSAARQRLVGALALLAILVGVMALPPAAAGRDGEHDLKERKGEVRDRIHDRKDHLDEVSREYSTATRRLRVAQDNLRAARTRLTGINERLAPARQRADELAVELREARERLRTATQRLREGRRDTEKQKADLRDIVTGAYGKGDAQLRAFGSLLNAESLDDLTLQLTVQDVVIGSNEDAYVELQDAERRLEQRRAEVRRIAREVAGKERAAREQEQRILAIYTQMRTWRDRVAGLVRGMASARLSAYRAKVRDREILKQLRKREASITQRLRRLAARQRGRHGYRGNSGGFLSSPAPGAYVTSPYGMRQHPIYGYWGLHNGTDFGTGCGMRLRAGASGVVVNRYYDAVYGNRVFLNVGNVNGRSMTLVYNHLSRTGVSVGERVARGEAIGRSGTTGWSTGCHLHFSVLMNGTPVDPMKYL
jgi:murein DD-endopeptidase MepM/ murein hydrolase activator NlpD